MFFILLNSCTQQQDPLVFIAHPDWHTGNLEIGRYSPSNGTFANQDTIITDMKKFNPKYILLGGDMIGGMWLGDRRPPLAEEFGPDLTDGELVYKLATICFNGINNRFRSYGLEPIGILGDHEMGDQNWTLDMPRSYVVEEYKQAFADAYTIDENGNSKYDGYIGSVPQRPVGSQYENTAYAFVDQNVLFIQVDNFRYEGEGIIIHDVQGVLSTELPPEQEEWMDELLTEAAGMDDIQFTIVQAHQPILHPIRKVQTSCITINDCENSSFWKLLQKHKVDVYFSGEVHALTPIIDKESQVAHIICGSFLGNTAHNYMVCKAYDNRLEMTIREKIGDGEEFIYESTGKMIIDKSSGEKEITTSGRLDPINVNRPLFHYSFDQEEITDRIHNSGEFGSRLYRGLPVNVELGQGIIGKSLVFPKGSEAYFHTKGKNPIVLEYPRTLSAWVNTTQKEKGMIWALGGDSYCMFLENGVPGIQAGKNIATADVSSSLNDGQWHHIAAVYPGNGSMKDIQFYVDGEPVATETASPDEAIDTHFCAGVMYAGARSEEPRDYYTGMLDDIRIWFSAVPASEIAGLYNQVAN